MHAPEGRVFGRHEAPSVEALLGFKASAGDEREVYRAGDLTREFGITRRTLRAYEEKGFLRPARQGIRRLYSRLDRKRLRIAVLSQTFGFTLMEAAQIIELYVGFRNINTTVGVTD